MSVIKNYLYNAFYQIFNLLVPLVTTPYLARVLGPSGVGINAYTSSIIQYFIIIGCIGTNIYGNRKIAFVRNDKYKLSQTFYEIFILRFIILMLSYFAFFIYLNFTDEFHIYYLAQSLAIIGTMFDISWFFMGIEKFSITVFRNIIVRIITLLCIFIFVKNYNDLLSYILIISLSTFFGNITMFTSLKKYINLPNFRDMHIFFHLWPSFLLFIPEVATQIYLVLNKTMLGIFVSVQASGFYDQSDKIIKMVLAVVTATGTVMLPHVANSFANGEVKKTKEYLYNSFSLVNAFSIPMMFGVIAISSKLVPLFFTKSFMIVSPLMMVESIVIFMIGISNVIGVQYLLPTNQTHKYTKSVILGSVANIILNIPLIFIFNVMGAVIATVISEIIVTIYQLYSIKNEIKYKLLFKDTYKYLLSGFIMFIVVYYLNIVLPITWLMLTIEVLIGFFLYLLLIYIFKANIFEIINKIKNNW